MKLIVFNGPPGSGKDTGAKAWFHTSATSHFERFSRPCKEALSGTLNTSLDGWYNFFDNKEAIHPILGVSLRQWQIDYSEKFMKPLYGEDIFARLLISRLRNYSPEAKLQTAAIADCGFQVELNALAKEFGAENILLFYLYREGRDFSKDSRGYVVAPPGMKTFTVHNNESKAIFEATIIEDINYWLRGGLK